MRLQFRVFFYCAAILVLVHLAGCESIATSKRDRWISSFNAAIAAERSDDRDAVRAHLDRALESIVETDAGFLYMRAITLEWMARLLIEEGQIDEALVLLDSARAVRNDSLDDRPKRISGLGNSSSAMLVLSAARNLVEAGRLDEGEELHDRYLRFVWKRSMRISASLWMAVTLLNADEPERSLRHFQAWTKLSPLTPNVRTYSVIPHLILYADALDAAGRPDDATALRLRIAGVSLGPDYLASIKAEYDKVAFRAWEPNRLPFKLHVGRTPPEWHEAPLLMGVVREAAQSWTDRVRPGVPAFEWVDDPEGADIVIDWAITAPRQNLLGHALPLFSHERRRILDVRIGVVIGTPGDPVPIEQLYHVVLHELGHAIGLYGHSPSPNDLMYPYFEKGGVEISERDIATLRQLHPCAWDGPGLLVYRRPEAEFHCDD